MKSITSLISTSLFRVFVIAMLSTCLICAPLWAMKSANATTRNMASADQNLQVAPPQQLAEHQPRELLIKLLRDMTPQAEHLFNSFGKNHSLLRGGGGVVRLTLKDHLDFRSTISTLQQLDNVIEWIEPNYVVRQATSEGPISARPNDPQFSAQWALDNRGQNGGARGSDIGVRAGWRTTAGSRQTIIAVIDTGVDARHPDLKRNLWINQAEGKGRSGADDDYNGYADDVRGWNFINNSNDATDDHGHGTMMAGIIAAEGNNARGVSGVMQKASVMPLKALDASGKGTVAAVVEAMDFAIEHQASVINCSFGAPAYSRAMLEAINRASAKGIVVVAAAGNNSKDLAEEPYYPASYQAGNLISVAATTNGDLLAGFSNWNQAKAHLAAPGVDVLTTKRGGGYASVTGSSAAAALVSGVSGLLKTAQGWASASNVRHNLIRSARPVPALKDKVASGGVINVAEALSAFNGNNKGSSVIANKSKGRPNTNRIAKRAPKRAAMQSGANLDTMRANQPSAPDAYQQTGTLPPANYDDPKPTTTANFSSYLTQMSLSNNATGVAGSLPMQAVDPTAGSASISGLSYNLDSLNYNFSAPVLSLSGRAGMNVSLTLSYNSKVWTKDPNTNKMIFNGDKGFPAPGWRLGFGAILLMPGGNPYVNGVTGAYSVIYLAPDGTRHDLKHTGDLIYVSYDSSYLEFNASTRVLRTPNGAAITFGAESMANGDNLWLPTLIKDRNGNQINIYYRTLSNNAVVIDYVIDTAGRRIDFNYQNNRLTWIGQNRNGVWAYFVRIDYTPVTIQTNFEGPLTTDPININGAQVYLPSRITYPTGAQHRFFYTSYGQAYLIQKIAPGIAGQGIERLVAYTRFNLPSLNGAGYPAAPMITTEYQQPTDCPSFTGRFDQAENWQGGAEQGYSYFYNMEPGAYPPPYDHHHQVYDPSGRSFRLFFSGLTRIKATYAPNAYISSKEERVTYTQDAGLSYSSNLRAQEVRISDNSGNVLKTSYSYTQLDGMWLPTIKDEYQGDSATVYRRTATSYTSYPAQRILGLVSQVSVYAGLGTTLMSRTNNVYDETGTFVDSNGQTASYFIDATADGVIQHDSAYGASFTQRGNLTSVTQSSVVGGAINGSRIVRRTSYDTNGNARGETDGAGNRRQFVFSDYYSNKPGGVGQTHAHVYTSADPTDFRAGAQYDYFDGHVVKTFNLRPGSSVEEQITTSAYDFADRLLQQTRPDGGVKRYGYWDNWGYRTVATSTNTGQLHFEFTEFDGAGRMRRKANDHPGGASGKYSGQQFVFDKVGMQTDASNVIAIYGDWTIHPEDASTGWVFTNTSRDELVRLKLITRPDGNTLRYDYTGCGCAGTSTVTETDETGCKVKTETDFLGRVWKVTEMSAPNTPYNQVIYSYDAVDHITQITHTNGSGSQSQTRSFVYDGYGRLQSETNPESGTLTYTYNPNDGVETVSDQRGIVRTYSYNTRNLPTGVSYNDGGATPSVSFGYDEFGARSSMADGEGATSYTYNAYRQLQSETRTFTNVTGKNFTLNYTYNLANQVMSANYVVSNSSAFLNTPEPGRMSSGVPSQVATTTRPDRRSINRPGNARPVVSATALKPGQKAQWRRSSAETAAPRVVKTSLRRVVPPTSAPFVRFGGNVSTAQGAGIAGVTVTVTGGAFPTSTTTDSNGNYAVSSDFGSTYTVTPSKAGYTFNPTSRSYTTPEGDIDDANFTGTPPPPPSGSLSANPNPIQVCNGTGQGATTLSWTTGGGVTSVQVRRDSPSGTLVASGGASGNVTTGAWVTNGTVFYLQNVTGGLPLTSANTLATRTVMTTTQGCPPSGGTFSKTINYARNKTGSITSIGTNLIGSDPNAIENVASGMSYRAWNVYWGMNFGNGLRQTAGYNDQRRQLTSLVVDRQNGSSTLLSKYYDYYTSGLNNGRIRRISDNSNFSSAANYGYDSFNRLTTLSGTLGGGFQYDEWGNMRSMYSSAISYATNGSGAPATNRISSAGGYSFSYDAAGNMTAGNGQTFSYDAANRLKAAGGVANQYGYDGDGKRVRQPGLYYVQSSVLDQVAFEVDASANVQRAYVYLGKEVLALQSTDGNFYWSHSDHLSSGRMLTTTSGTVVYRADFAPFGQVSYEWAAAGNTNLNKRKFTGYERDATGLDYANARSYTSSWGRFIQADPLGSGYRGSRPNPLGAANQGRPQTLNRYSYVSNDPINFTDPSGLLKSPDEGCVCCGGDGGGGGDFSIDIRSVACRICNLACVTAALGCYPACLVSPDVITIPVKDRPAFCRALCLALQDQCHKGCSSSVC